MRSSPLLSEARLLAPLLMVVLLLTASGGAATPTRESQLTCSPTETEPYGVISCAIHVRDGYQEPTMSFNPADFTVTTRTSVPAAVVTKSALVRGSDVTTVMFTLFATTGTDVLIRVYLQENNSIGGTTIVGEVRGSGVTVSVLSWPASRLGPLTCGSQSTGLALRSSTICRAALYDANDAPSVVHSADVVFSEANALGSFAFVSGTRELVVRFTAPPTTPVIVSTFTIKARLRGEDTSGGGVQTSQFPLLYPRAVALSGSSGLRCAAETQPITCSVTAADLQGPVAFNATHFRVRLERAVGAGGQGSSGAGAARWADVTGAFNITVARSPLRPYVGVVSWEPRSNDAIYEAQLRVFASPDGQTIPGASGDSSAAVAGGRTADVAGSPYAFISGMLPNGPSVTLRGCRESVIASGNTTVCYVDLSNGISADPAFFLVTTTQRKSSVSNVTYVKHDPVCRCRSMWFTYHAPTALVGRVDDFINVSVYTDVEHSLGGIAQANNAPLHLDVFPVVSGSGHDTAAAATDAILVAVGLLFYGSVLGVGAVLIVRRSRKSARIRHERALKERAMIHEMDRRHGTPTPSTAAAHLAVNAGPPPVAGTGKAGGGGTAAATTARDIRVALACGTESGATGYDSTTRLDANAGGSAAPPMTPTAVVSNVAVPQHRFHSDSD
ncbi:hypothetical protein NESM_000388900 [Novymonas esmeraldas]|uniref:Membrane-associated protein n=1 Tax=Novymonas esmeraldas TaxID=1808958 RepID=A0AAW0ENC7_9TRYP